MPPDQQAPVEPQHGSLNESMFQTGKDASLPFEPVSPHDCYQAGELLAELKGIMPPELWRYRRDLEVGRVGGERLELRLRLEAPGWKHFVVDPEVFRAHPRDAGTDSLSRESRRRPATELGTAEMVNNGIHFDDDRFETIGTPVQYKIRTRPGHFDLVDAEVETLIRSPDAIPEVIEQLLDTFPDDVEIHRFADEDFTTAPQDGRTQRVRIFNDEERSDDEQAALDALRLKPRLGAGERAGEAAARAAARYQAADEELKARPYSLARVVMQENLTALLDRELHAAQRAGGVSSEILNVLPPRVRAVARTDWDSVTVTIETPWQQEEERWQARYGHGRQYLVSLDRSTHCLQFSLDAEGHLVWRER